MGMTAVECKNLCLNVSTFKCKSLDYRFDDDGCFLSSKTKDDISLSTKPISGEGTHYHLTEVMIDNLLIKQRAPCNFI